MEFSSSKIIKTEYVRIINEITDVYTKRHIVDYKKSILIQDLYPNLDKYMKETYTIDKYLNDLVSRLEGNIFVDYVTIYHESKRILISINPDAIKYGAAKAKTLHMQYVTDLYGKISKAIIDGDGKIFTVYEYMKNKVFKDVREALTDCPPTKYITFKCFDKEFKLNVVEYKLIKTITEGTRVIFQFEKYNEKSTDDVANYEHTLKRLSDFIISAYNKRKTKLTIKSGLIVELLLEKEKFGITKDIINYINEKYGYSLFNINEATCIVVFTNNKFNNTQDNEVCMTTIQEYTENICNVAREKTEEYIQNITSGDIISGTTFIMEKDNNIDLNKVIKLLKTLTIYAEKKFYLNDIAYPIARYNVNFDKSEECIAGTRFYFNFTKANIDEINMNQRIKYEENLKIKEAIHTLKSETDHFKHIKITSNKYVCDELYKHKQYIEEVYNFVTLWGVTIDGEQLSITFHRFCLLAKKPYRVKIILHNEKEKLNKKSEYKTTGREGTEGVIEHIVPDSYVHVDENDHYSKFRDICNQIVLKACKIGEDVVNDSKFNIIHTNDIHVQTTELSFLKIDDIIKYIKNKSIYVEEYFTINDIKYPIRKYGLKYRSYSNDCFIFSIRVKPPELIEWSEHHTYSNNIDLKTILGTLVLRKDIPSKCNTNEIVISNPYIVKELVKHHKYIEKITNWKLMSYIEDCVTFKYFDDYDKVEKNTSPTIKVDYTDNLINYKTYIKEFRKDMDAVAFINILLRSSIFVLNNKHIGQDFHQSSYIIDIIGDDVYDKLTPEVNEIFNNNDYYTGDMDENGIRIKLKK